MNTLSIELDRYLAIRRSLGFDLRTSEPVSYTHLLGVGEAFEKLRPDHRASPSDGPPNSLASSSVSLRVSALAGIVHAFSLAR